MKKPTFIKSLASLLTLLCLLLCGCGNKAENSTPDKSNDISFEESHDKNEEKPSETSAVLAASEESDISEEPEVSDVKPQKETTKIAVFGDSIVISAEIYPKKRREDQKGVEEDEKLIHDTISK